MGSVSTSVKGLIKKDSPEYEAHYEVFCACVNAGVNIPTETARILGVSVTCTSEEEVEEVNSVKLKCLEIHDDMNIHYEVRVEDIPKEVETIRFTNSW